MLFTVSLLAERSSICTRAVLFQTRWPRRRQTESWIHSCLPGSCSLEAKKGVQYVAFARFWKSKLKTPCSSINCASVAIISLKRGAEALHVRGLKTAQHEFDMFLSTPATLEQTARVAASGAAHVVRSPHTWRLQHLQHEAGKSKLTDAALLAFALAERQQSQHNRSSAATHQKGP